MVRPLLCLVVSLHALAQFRNWWVATTGGSQTILLEFARIFQVLKKNNKKCNICNISLLTLIVIMIKLKDNKYYSYKIPGLLVS
jgi:hypothetical protein